MCVSSRVKVHELYHILQMIDNSWGRDSELEIEKAEEVRVWRWGGDGVGRNEMRGGHGPLLRGRASAVIRSLDFTPRPIGNYCLGGVSVLRLAYVT